MSETTPIANGDFPDRMVPRQEPKAPIVSGGKAMAIMPQTFEEVFRLANMLAQTQMVPQNFQGKPADTAAALMYGLEVGLSPIAALQSIAVVNGRPCLWGDALPALMLRNGCSLDETIEGEGDAMIAVCRLTRQNGQTVERRFSVADAKMARLWGKTGPWQQYPKRMLQMRARGFAVRDGAADIMRGLSVAEDQQDVEPMRDVTPTPAQRISPPSPPPPAPVIELAKEPATGTAKSVAPQAPEPAREPDIQSDIEAPADRFCRTVEDSMAAAKDLDTLGEVFANNEEWAKDLGTMKSLQEMYDRHESRIERF